MMERNEDSVGFAGVVPEPGVTTVIAGCHIEEGDVTTDFAIFRSASGKYETHPMVAETVERENDPEFGGPVTTVIWGPVSRGGVTLKSVQSFYDSGEPVTIIRGTQP